MRDIEQNPYSKDEARVAQFFANAGTGGGDDPIGFLITSHQYAMQQRNCYRKALEIIKEQCEHGGPRDTYNVAAEALSQ